MKSFGIVLGGGGARGLVHIGILKVLEEEGIAIDYVAGASIGGILGAAYALGYSPAELEEIALRFTHLRELVKLLDPSAARRGLLLGSRVQQFLSEIFGEHTFADLRLPTALCAVDLVHACEVTLNQGSLLTAAMATSAVPGVFDPVEVDGMRLVDGGVLKNVPVDLARELGAEVVLAIDPQIHPEIDPPWHSLPDRPRWPFLPPEGFLDFYRADLCMVSQLTRLHFERYHPDLILYPPLPPDMTMFLGFPRSAEAITAGEQAARQILPELRRLLQPAG